LTLTYKKKNYNIIMLLKAYNNILIVVKQTPYQQYLQLKAQGKAPVALRWERLQNRDEAHSSCVNNVINIINDIGIKYTKISREELYRGSLQDKDLVIAVGGDGTVLNTSSFIDDSIPVLGINSDPSKPDENRANHKKDERRSRGALCAISAFNLHDNLAKILYGDIAPGLRTRIQCLVRSTYTETRLPPALNDILLCHPSPAAVSRFRLHFCKNNNNNDLSSSSSSSSSSITTVPTSSSSRLGASTTTPQTSSSSSMTEHELFSFNVWSSGIWISTPTGSTAAMHAAGGDIMDIRSRK
jgi:NAD+ kinase